eukprot:CAMPEP_0119139206 /NCGR_PEP_ID=MMETSP1310-20130426/27101_1 /TAXON_ID=464262 /ORGANISM="Genus nov. species nov., Strain RCC2339" /LENGTH=819 /DNA_ID=CAMNT_0007130473 /DNA_START=263 /DNA_END=2719 /DNA_ORIENTATION=+
MDFVHPTAEWKALYNRHYRKMEVYRMQWRVDLKSQVVAAANFGGPVAVRKGEGLPEETIAIYTSSGVTLGSFHWTKGVICGWGWTKQENLVLILGSGEVFVYSARATTEEEPLKKFSLGPEVEKEGLIGAYVWDSGLAVMSKTYRFWAVPNLSDPSRIVEMANPALSEAPSYWTAIPPEKTVSRNVEVLVASQDTILILDEDACQDQLLSSGPFTSLAVSTSGKLIACFNKSGLLMVMTTDFNDNKIEFPTGCRVPPEQLIWCGSDTVLLYWDKVLLMVGPKKEDKTGWIKYSYEDPIHVITEVDGARILSNGYCEFLQKVPLATENIFKIGSTHPAAILYDALDHFDKKNPRADESLRTIRYELAEAVAACIEAAGYEFNITAQRTLLRAASFGKCFLDFYNPDDFVTMCKKLRVLNAVRDYKIGIPITITQCDKISPSGLVDRLMNRHDHLLAWRVCEFLDLKGQNVLVNWACAKVQSVKDPSAAKPMAKLIVRKLSKVHGISYARIASTAFKYGQQELATLLLDHEPRAADQVPLLTYMQQDELALIKAIESGDTDLVYLVLLHIQRERPPKDFFRIIRSKPVALRLQIKYCKDQDLELLKDIYYQQGDMEDLGNIAIHEAYQQDSFEGAVKKLETSVQIYGDGGKDLAPRVKQLEDEKRLLIMQRALELKLKKKFLGLSLVETILRLLVLKNEKTAAKFKSEFKVSDKRYFWIRFRALAERKDWPELQALSREKRTPPIGWKPFADVCIAADEPREAVRYIQKIPEPQVKMKLWIAIGYWREAAVIAIQLRSMRDLAYIKANCESRDTIAFIEQE